MAVLGEAVLRQTALGLSQYIQFTLISFYLSRGASCQARPAAGAQVHSQHSKVPLVAREEYAEPRMVQSLKPLPNRKELGKTFKQLGKVRRRRHLPSVRTPRYSPPSAAACALLKFPRNMSRPSVVAINGCLSPHGVT